MVLPFILGAAAIGAGVTGIKKGIDAVSDNSKAKQLQEDTRAIYEISERDLKGMDLFKEAAAKLGAVNLKIAQGNLFEYLKGHESILDSNVLLNVLSKNNGRTLLSTQI